MTDHRNHLPGIYASLRPFPGESLSGYVLRLAEANGYGGVAELLAVVSKHTVELKVSRPAQLYSKPVALAVLSRMATGLDDALMQFAASRVPEDSALVLGETRVDDDALMDIYAQVCPACLSEREYALEEWDLAPVTCCAKHSLRLLDRCTDCAQRLDWRRDRLHHCGKCGSDIRGMSTEVASAAEVGTSEDFAALAPFRFELGGEQRIEPWDSGFVLVRLIALPSRYWAALEPAPRRFFRDLDAMSRASAVQLLASFKEDGVYLGDRIGSALRDKVRHLDALPAGYDSAEGVVAYSVKVDRLLNSTARALVGLNPRPERGDGALLCQGRPPVIGSLDELRNYLGASEMDITRLRRARMLPSRWESDLGYDFDSVLRARRFLDTELVPIESLSSLLGASISKDDRRAVAYCLGCDAGEQEVVESGVLASFQQRLRAMVESLDSPELPVRLEEVVSGDSEPALALVRLVTHLLHGGFSSASWGAPYTWASIRLERSEVAQYLGPARLSSVGRRNQDTPHPSAAA